MDMSFMDGSYQLLESQVLEFKEAAGGLPDDLWETYSAFANTEGGEIVLGVHEDKKTHEFSLAGVPDPAGLMEQFWNEIRNPKKVSRDILLHDSVKAVHRDSLDFVVITVPRADRNQKPIEIYSRSEKNWISWIRKGAGDYKASQNELRLMRYDSVAQADRSALDEFGLDAICTETVRRYRNIFAAQKPNSPWIDDSDNDFLYHIGALAKGHDDQLHPTTAGLLAFGYEYEITNYLPQYLLDYREETSGLTRWDDRVVSQSGDWSGNVIDFYLTVTQRFRRYFKIPFTTDVHGTSHSATNPLDEAVNEALANAIIHSYYGSPCTILVRLEPHKLTISNPGNLLMDKDVAIAGGYSETRNPTLMRIFNFINVSDRAGSGLQSIWRTWKDTFSQEPALEELHLPARIELVLPLGDVRVDKVIPTYAALPETGNRRLIFETVCLKGSAGAGVSDIASETNLSERTVQKILKELFEMGFLTRIRDNHRWVYLESRI